MTMSPPAAADIQAAAAELRAQIAGPDWLVGVAADEAKARLLIQITRRLKLVDSPPQFPDGFQGFPVRYWVVDQ